MPETFDSDQLVRFTDQLRRFDSTTVVPASGTGAETFGSDHLVRFTDQLRRF